MSILYPIQPGSIALNKLIFLKYAHHAYLVIIIDLLCEM